MSSESFFDSFEAFELIAALCSNESKLTEPELVDDLKAILIACPDDVANQTFEDDMFGDGTTLLHCAAETRCVEFCKLLVEKNPRAVTTANDFGRLPFHYSCLGYNVETAKYLFSLYPDSIHIPDNEGCYPIHLFCRVDHNWDSSDENTLEMTKFLLQNDRGAVSIPERDGCLPLHYVSMYMILPVVVLIYHAYPEAIITRYGNNSNGGYTPLDEAYGVENYETANYLETQLGFIRQTQEDMEQDYYGNLPIHRLLQNKEMTSATIKVMLAANPNSIRMANKLGMLPIHIACLYNNLDIVKVLVEANGDSLQKCDKKGNSALHLACLAGKTDVVNYILEKSDHGVSKTNADGNLPIQLLLFRAKCNRDSMEYTDAVDSLIRAYPAVTTFLGVKRT